MQESKFKIGIIGCGFVGSAVAAGFALKADIKIYDKHKHGFDSLLDVARQDIIFLCLPTPIRKSDDKPEMSFIHEALDSLTKVMIENNICGLSKIIVIKSTVLPGTNRMLQAKYPHFKFVSNPEFLTARSARLDFINASRIIIGYDSSERLGNAHELVDLYRTICPHTQIYLCKWETAEFVKYMANCFFALKVSYLNEIYLLCQKIGIDYNEAKLMWLSDGRIGNSHHEVPGYDGDFGFGGTCFPKDLAAFIAWARDMGEPAGTLEAAKSLNDQIRKNKDWEVFDDAE